MRNFKKILISLCLLLLPGIVHATVEVNAIKSLNAPNQPYQAILLTFSGPLKEKKTFEKKMIKALAKLSSTKFYGETEILPPVGQYTPEQIQSTYASHGIEAILTATLTHAESQYTVTEVPDTVYYSGKKNGKRYHGQIETTRPEVSRRDYYTHQINLQDLIQKQDVWTAESESSAGALTHGWTKNSIISKTAKALTASGLIEKK